MSSRKCENCGRTCYGFWKYGPSSACSLACFRNLIATGKVPRLKPEFGHRDLGILSPEQATKVWAGRQWRGGNDGR